MQDMLSIMLDQASIETDQRLAVRSAVDNLRPKVPVDVTIGFAQPPNTHLVGTDKMNLDLAKLPWRFRQPYASQPESVIEWREKAGGFKSGLIDGPETGDCLRDFVKLRDATNDEVLAFAKKWGVLGVRPTIIEEIVRGQVLFRYVEPVAYWHFYAGHAYAILWQAAQLISDDTSRQEYWSQVARTDIDAELKSKTELDKFWFKNEKLRRRFSDVFPDGDPDMLIRRMVIQSAVYEWLKDVPSVLEFDWLSKDIPIVYSSVRIRTDEWDLQQIKRQETTKAWSSNTIIRNRPSVLFSILAMQIASALTSSTGVAICDICNEPYPRKSRKPQRGRQNYCSDECRLEAQRGHMRDYARRRRARSREGNEANE